MSFNFGNMSNMFGIQGMTSNNINPMQYMMMGNSGFNQQGMFGQQQITKLDLFSAFAQTLNNSLKSMEQCFQTENKPNNNQRMYTNPTGTNSSASSSIFESKGNRGEDFDSFTNNALSQPDSVFDFTQFGYENGDGVDAYRKEVMGFSEDIIKHSDKNSDGKLDFDEFFAQSGGDSSMSAEGKKAFSNVDLNGDGRLDSKENAAILAYMDNDEDGKVDGHIKCSDTALPLANERVKSGLQSSFNFLFGE